jgi:hypothetical protein
LEVDLLLRRASGLLTVCLTIVLPVSVGWSLAVGWLLTVLGPRWSRRAVLVARGASFAVTCPTFSVRWSWKEIVDTRMNFISNVYTSVLSFFFIDSRHMA